MKQNISYYQNLSMATLTTPMGFNLTTPGPIFPGNINEFNLTYTEVTTAIQNLTERYETEPVANNTYCFQVLVDCATLSTPATATSTPEQNDTSTTLEAEYIYDEDDYDVEYNRSRRQIDTRLGSTESPIRTTPRNLARIFDTLNSILRNLRNATTRQDNTTGFSTTTPFATSGSSEELIDDTTTSEWQALTSESEYDTTLFQTTDTFPDSNSTDLPTTRLCYVTVCQNLDNDTQFTSDYTTLPCRGDNPEGCTDYWTSGRENRTTQWYHATEALELTTVRYTLGPETRVELRKLCWETMFGQELVKLTVMDLVLTVAAILIIDFIRAVFVRVFNSCWCWDLEKYFPQYGEFKIAENILHLVNNQGMIWMGMFFSPGLPAINLFKLVILLYVRSWAVLTCNVPHEVIFRASRSNNFYLWLLLSMLFLCTLPVAYAIVWLEPSWHCGPFSDYRRMFHVLTEGIYNSTPKSLHWVLQYIASPGVVIPLLVLLILVIYYLLSLSNSLREAVTDLRTQIRRERDAERQKQRENAEANNAAGQGPAAQTQQKTIPQWRKAVTPATLAKEAAEKRLGNKSIPKTKTGVAPPSPRANDAAQMDGDGSDLDISESLPNDSIARSPVVIGRAVMKQNAQPVYAVVKKKKSSNAADPPASKEVVKEAPSRKTTVEQVKTVPKPARSKPPTGSANAGAAGDIPLIKISKTESLEKAEPETEEPTEPDEMEAEDDFREVTSDNSSGSQGKRGALNLILERAKQKMAAKGIIEKDSKILVTHMEETAAETPVKSGKTNDLQDAETGKDTVEQQP